MRIRFALALLLCIATPAAAGADFTLVNGSGEGLSSLSIRRTGTADWRALAASLSNGARTDIPFREPDCAYDLRATVGGTETVWRGVNLCEVSTVTLRRSPSGAPFVEYD